MPPIRSWFSFNPGCRSRHRHYTPLLLLGGLLLSTACAPTPSLHAPLALADPITSPAPQVQAPTLPPPAPSPQLRLISAQGMGEARLGMTLAQLQQTLGPEYTFAARSPFMVDFDAIAVLYGGEVQYYILHLAGQPLSPNDTIQGLLTDNPAYRTAQGIGATVPLRQAEAVYGRATLSYHLSNESREYVRFQRHPATNISFATGNGNSNSAGIYPSPSGEYNETQQYRDDGTIQAVLVVCLSPTCAR